MYTVSSESTSSLSPMMSFCGKCHPSHLSPVIGKLVFGSGKVSAFHGGAYLPVISGDADTASLDSSSVVGIVRINSEKITEHGDVSTPYPSITLAELPESCNGKIALLDPATSTLFVSPDIVTVNRYNKRLFRSIYDNESYPLILPGGKKIRLFLRAESGTLCDRGDGTIIDASDLLCSEGEPEHVLYERFRDVAEEMTALPITVSVDGRSCFPQQLRAIFRSAVYGNFSLLFKGLLDEQRLRQLLQSCHKIFCELEGERREFNGYIPKGICVDTPFLLTEKIGFDGIDLCCFDIETLSSLMTDGIQTDSCIVFKKIISYIDGFCETEAGVRRSAILGEEHMGAEILSSLIRRGIYDFYILPQCLLKARKTIRNIIGY